jgi:D-arabinose 1-dehydrogenase-like Zn-dependent alcohol dehydrogenase
MMAKMRVVQISRRNGPLEMVEREIPQPRAGTVRIKVEACGICHTDTAIVAGLLPGIQYPRVPGHEVAGVIDALGPGVAGWSTGQRVGVGYNGGYDGTCEPCRRGDFVACTTAQITGATFDGGYADYMIAPTSALALLPAELSPTDAAPLMCAGVTTFNGLRRSGARPGDVVAVLGIGGLGHLAVQYAAKMGMQTIALGRGRDKEPFARKLGASRYIDSKTEDTVAELGKLGGAKVIAATATSAKAISAVIPGLAWSGKLLILGVPIEPLEVSAFTLFSGRRSIEGVNSGTSIDSQDTAAFSVQANVRPMNEVFPFDQAVKAYERMASGDARFRVVLDMKR